MNFGTVNYDHQNQRWKIECEAHVCTKLKRLFPEVYQGYTDTIALSDNEENCRDLLWFMQRYPMDIAPEQLVRMENGAKRHQEQESIVTALLEARHPPEDFELAIPARDYQKVAATLTKIKRGTLVADAVGLGKTITGICPMAEQQHLPALVVTLSHLPSQWEQRLNQFAPQLQTHILKTGKPYDLVPKKRKQSGLFDEPRLPDVIICNYHKLHGWAEVLAGLVRYVVFDEIQELRRDESLKYDAAKYIAGKANLRMGLSATPIYNYGIEFFNVIEVLQPGALGTKQEFLREWCTDERNIRDPKAFGEYLRREGIMIRRSRKDVGRELPPVSKIPQTIEADLSALDRIKGSAVELAKVILAANQTRRGEKFLASEEFNVLMRQATGVAKAPYVAEFVRMILDSEEKVILYGWHHEVYAIWKTALAEFNPVLYTGKESPKQKDESKEAFISGDSRVMIISLRAGAGLDGLEKACRTVIFGELDWSPGAHEQCIGRVDRDDGIGPVMAYFLIAEEGSDPVIADVLGIKRQQIEGVVDPNAELIERLETDTGNLKRLAETYLKKHGHQHELQSS